MQDPGADGSIWGRLVENMMDMENWGDHSTACLYARAPYLVLE